MKFDIILDESDSFESYYNEKGNSLKFLRDASKINILIGSNNSGKSRFIRSLAVLKNRILILEDIRTLINFWNLNIVNDRVIFHNHNRHNNLGGFSLNNLEDEYGNIKFLKFSEYDLHFETENKTFLSKNQDIFDLNKQALDRGSNIAINGTFYGIDSLQTKVIEDFLLNLNNIVSEKLIKDNLKSVFIPALRTAHSIFQLKNDNSFSKISTDIFKQTILKSYQLDDNKIEIFTGMDLY